jgi:predicted Zn-dependent protease
VSPARRRCGIAWALALWLGLPLAAQAFVRSRDPDTNACLWWKERTVEIHLNNACSRDTALAACQNAVWTTFERWNEPICSDFRFIAAGITDRDDVGFDQNNWNDNINLVVWRETTWGHDPQAIAITTTTYDTLTGEVVDSDIELNGRDYTFSTAESDEVLVDIANTLAHEAGHTVGLDHSSDPNASMYGYAPPGEIRKRDLSQDDIDGLCHVYPYDRDLPPCEGFEPPGGNGGCSAAGARSGAAGGSLAGLGLWLLWLQGRLIRRRRGEEET